MSDFRNPTGAGMGAAGHPHATPSQPGLRPPIQQPAVRPPAVPSARPGIAPMPTIRPQQVADDPIALVEELTELEEAPKAPAAATAAPTPASKIKFGPDLGHKKHEWKRKTHVTGQGACRVKSFHGKYSEQGVEHLDDMINEWLDDHPEVEVKFVTQTVHVFEGKIREPALVLNIWY
jgi:hypothetical protein